MGEEMEGNNLNHEMAWKNSEDDKNVIDSS